MSAGKQEVVSAGSNHCAEVSSVERTHSSNTNITGDHSKYTPGRTYRTRTKTLIIAYFLPTIFGPIDYGTP